MSSTKRRAAAACLVLSVGTALAGCSANPSSKTSSNEPSSTPAGRTLKTATFVSLLPTYPTWKRVGQCMSDEATANGVKLTVTGPTGGAPDPAVMIQQVQQAVANKADAIITVPATEAFGPVLKQAQAAGIFTGTILGSGLPDSGADINLGIDFAKIATAQIASISARPGQQNLGLIAAGASGIGKQWLDAIKAAAATTSNVKIVGEVYTGDVAAKALDQVNALLTTHKEINVIASHMGTVTPGAVASIKAKKLVGKVALEANGSGNGGKEALAEGTAVGLLMADYCSIGKSLMSAIVMKAKGETPPPVDLNFKIVSTPAEATSLLADGWE